MSVTVLIPAVFQNITGYKEKIECSSGTILDIISQLEVAFPGIAEKLVEHGNIKKFINIYINDKDIRFLSRQNTVAKDGDLIMIIPAVSEG